LQILLGILKYGVLREKKMLLTGDKEKDRLLWRDIHWSREHSQELHDQYERQWVAIYGQQVVAAGKDPRAVERNALEKTRRPREEVYIIYVEDSQAFYGKA
jgi:hypothetical protein